MWKLLEMAGWIYFGYSLAKKKGQKEDIDLRDIMDYVRGKVDDLKDNLEDKVTDLRQRQWPKPEEVDPEGDDDCCTGNCLDTEPCDGDDCECGCKDDDDIPEIGVYDGDDGLGFDLESLQHEADKYRESFQEYDEQVKRVFDNGRELFSKFIRDLQDKAKKPDDWQ